MWNFDGAADVSAATQSGALWTLTVQNVLPGAHDLTGDVTDLAGDMGSFALAQVVVNVPTLTSSHVLSKSDFA